MGWEHFTLINIVVKKSLLVALLHRQTWMHFRTHMCMSQWLIGIVSDIFRMFLFPTTQSNNVTFAGDFSLLIHVTLPWLRTENIPTGMHLFSALQSVGEKQFYVKSLPHFFSFPLLSYYCTYNKTVA